LPMDRQFGEYRYVSSFVRDCQEGYAGLEMYRHANGKNERVATVIFWDACGQFFVETLGADVPLEIIEALIAETKTVVKTG
jgi:hypothetical protein